MTVILANPNTSIATTAAMARIARTVLPDVTGWTAPSGPEMILSEAALAGAADLVAAMEVPGDARGVIVAAFGDPGREALARRVGCPVIGIGEAAAREAARHGAFAVVTTTPGLAGAIDALMIATIGSGYLGCLVTDADPLSLMSDPVALDAHLADRIADAAAAGARAVVIGGGPLGEAAERLSGGVPLPIVNPVKAAAREMRLLCERGRRDPGAAPRP